MNVELRRGHVLCTVGADVQLTIHYINQIRELFIRAGCVNKYYTAP